MKVGINIHNDGKEKSSSWEARLHLEASAPLGGGYGFVDAVGYGDDEEDAVQSLKDTLESMGMDPSSDLIDFDNRTRVAWDNTPL